MEGRFEAATCFRSLRGVGLGPVRDVGVLEGERNLRRRILRIILLLKVEDLSEIGEWGKKCEEFFEPGFHTRNYYDSSSSRPGSRPPVPAPFGSKKEPPPNLYYPTRITGEHPQNGELLCEKKRYGDEKFPVMDQARPHPHSQCSKNLTGGIPSRTIHTRRSLRATGRSSAKPISCNKSLSITIRKCKSSQLTWGKSRTLLSYDPRRPLHCPLR
jgi:hypothetical protein